MKNGQLIWASVAQMIGRVYYCYSSSSSSNPCRERLALFPCCSCNIVYGISDEQWVRVLWYAE